MNARKMEGKTYAARKSLLAKRGKDKRMIKKEIGKRGNGSVRMEGNWGKEMTERKNREGEEDIHNFLSPSY